MHIVHDDDDIDDIASSQHVPFNHHSKLKHNREVGALKCFSLIACSIAPAIISVPVLLQVTRHCYCYLKIEMSFLTHWQSIKRISSRSNSLSLIFHGTRQYSRTSLKMASFNSENISKITDAEKSITGQDQPVKGGPTAQAQSHAGQNINR